MARSAAQRAAQRKATLASARARRGKSKGPSTARNSGVIGYGRINHRSGTVGFNAGRKIPRTKKRVVVGGYVRVESTTKNTIASKAVKKVGGGIFPGGTRRGKIASHVRKRVRFNNPAGRYTTSKGNQVRLGTSRSAGPTIIVRKGSHKTSRAKSASGVQKYDTRMKKIAGTRASQARPQRRKAAKG